MAAAALLTGAPFLAMLPASASAAAPASRAAHVTGAPAFVALGISPRIPIGARAIGAVASTATEVGAVVLAPRDNAGLTRFIATVTDKKSRFYHDYLPKGAFAQRFGPAQSSIDAVKSQLAADGLHVTGVASDGLLVTFSGSAAHVESAFHTGLRRYRLADGTTGQATTSAIRVPSTIASEVTAVVGLDDLVHAHSANIIRRPGLGVKADFPPAKGGKAPRVTGAPSACALASIDAQAFGGLTDDQIANSYGAFGLYGAGDFGAGQSIAVYELEPVLRSDINTFDTCYFGSVQSAAMNSRLTIGGPYNVDGGQPAGQGSGEAILDVQDVSGIAPGAKIDVYQAPNNTFGGIDEYAAIVNNDTEQVVTSSWGLCEQAVQLGEPGIQQTENLLFEQAAAQGQSIFSAAGDTGSDDCNAFRPPSPVAGQNPLSVDDPSSQPYVVAVGGTTIDDATAPPAEHVWNDGAQWGAGGGGISESWAMPTWQLSSRVPGIVRPTGADYTNANAVETGSGYPTNFCQSTLPGATSTTPCRLLPDVSAQADEFTGAITIYSTEFGGPFNGWITIGGTSSAAPIWAALLALVNASPTCKASSATANGVGFVSPLLYAVASSPAQYAQSFNDIKSGNNDIYGLDNGLVFPATAGYDLASGLGTPELTGPGGTNGLAVDLCTVPTAASTPTVTNLNPAVLPAAGGSVTITGTGFGSHAAPAIASIEVGSWQITTGIDVTSGTSLTVSFPPSSDLVPPNGPTSLDGTGPASVTLTSTTGQSSPLAPGKTTMEYVAATGTPNTPSVTGISPYGGSETAPTPVKILGSGFSAGATVSFGGLPATGVTVNSPFEITATPPAFVSGTTGCGGGLPTGETHTNDICQAQVVVTDGAHSSATATILPPYEGATLPPTPEGVPALPNGCACEEMPAPTEFDYVPAPSITSVSTTTADPSTLAGEFGGVLVTVKGKGFDPLTLDWLNIGDPTAGSSIDFCSAPGCTFLEGTEIQFVAPAIVGPGGATTQPATLPFSVKSLAGQASSANLVYAGLPQVSHVTNSNNATTVGGLSGAADTGGTPLTVAGVGLEQVFGPIGFVDAETPYSLGAQYNYTVDSDTGLTLQTVSQNPALTIVSVCSATGCTADVPGGLIILYPPGNPVIDSISPTGGPAQGGNKVAIGGENLGCVTSVTFGGRVAESFGNFQAILDCGSTNAVGLAAPPGPARTTVPVVVKTVESEFAGTDSNAASYTYSPSAPSAPVPFRVTPAAGSASVAWSTPVSDGGSPITSYRVTATSPGWPTQAVSLPAVQRSYTFAYLQPGIPWRFSVSAVSARGTGLTALSGPYVLRPGDNGYVVATSNGAAFGFGSLSSSGGPGGGALGAAIVGIAPTPDALGYFEAAANGVVYHFGNAGFYGSATVPSGVKIVGIASTPDGRGYWLAADDGAVYTFGDARYHGALSGVKNVVSIASTPDGGGYYLAEANGTVKQFGDGVFRGDMYGKPLSAPIVGIAVNAVNGGYWLVGGDGGVFSFGGGYYGSVPGGHVNASVAGMVGTPDGRGYWLVAADNGVFSFGAAHYAGNPMGRAQSAAVGITD